MAVEGCGKFLKYAVFFFNFLIFLGGAAVLGVGIWVLVDPGASSTITQMVPGVSMFKTAAYLLIACGAVVLILGFLGCCGAIKESKCMLGTFFALLFLIFIVLLVGGILAVIYKNKVLSILKDEMTSSLENQYGVDIANNKTNAAKTDSWDLLQKAGKCCGIDGDATSSTSWEAWQSSKWFKAQSGADKLYVPEACCTTDAKNATMDLCTGKRDTPNAAPRHAKPTVDNKYLNKVGCYLAIKKDLEDNIPIVAGIGIGIALLMLLAMIFAICLCRSIREDYQA